MCLIVRPDLGGTFTGFQRIATITQLRVITFRKWITTGKRLLWRFGARNSWYYRIQYSVDEEETLALYWKIPFNFSDGCIVLGCCSSSSSWTSIFELFRSEYHIASRTDILEGRLISFCWRFIIFHYVCFGRAGGATIVLTAIFKASCLVAQPKQT